jgi:hypothetical protein
MPENKNNADVLRFYMLNKWQKNSYVNMLLWIRNLALYMPVPKESVFMGRFLLCV